MLSRSGKTLTTRASNERLVNSSNSGLSCNRRIASRASPTSACAKMSAINCRSSTSHRCNLLGRQILKNAFFLGGGQLRQEKYQALFLVGDQFGEGEADMRCFQLRKPLLQIIAKQNELESQRRMKLLIPGRNIFHCRYDRLQL